MTRKADFLSIGAQKTASTTLWSLLRSHPEISMSKDKEIKYFCWESRYSKGDAWYWNQFEWKGPNTKVGEISPQYSNLRVYPETPARMRQYNPDMKILYCVRDPLGAAPSIWQQLMKQKESLLPKFPELKDFESALLSDAVIGNVLYYSTLQAYLKHFPESQVYVFFYEDFAADRDAQLAHICEFLGVDPEFRFPEGVHKNRTGRIFLRERFVRALRRHGFKQLPARAIARLRARDATPKIPKPVWTVASREMFRLAVKDDSRALLEWCGRDTGYWPTTRC